MEDDMTLFDVVHNTLTEYRRHTATEQTRAVIRALEDAKYIHRAMQYQDGLPMTEQDCPVCGVPSGTWCRDLNGNDWDGAHPARLEAARLT
jgi:hypothetical protein